MPLLQLFCGWYVIALLWNVPKFHSFRVSAVRSVNIWSFAKWFFTDVDFFKDENLLHRTLNSMQANKPLVDLSAAV